MSDGITIRYAMHTWLHRVYACCDSRMSKYWVILLRFCMKSQNIFLKNRKTKFLKFSLSPLPNPLPEGEGENP